MYKKTKILGAILGLLLLAGCGGSTTMKTINFSQFQMKIPEDFQKVSPGLVENKQIINKVIASYKHQQEGFSPNLIISVSPLEQEIDFEQFWTANTAKLKNFMVGYTPGEKELIAFDCGNKRIQGIFVSFQVKNTFYNKQQIYALSQYQFVIGERGYIISTAYLEKEKQKNLKKRIKTLECN